MIKIVSNSLNSCNKKILEKMNKMDFEFIKREAVSQLEHGAEYIQLNAVSLLDNEISFYKKVIPIIENLGGKVLIRSNNIETLSEVIDIAKKEVIIGDIEFDKEKIDFVVETIKGNNVKIIALIRENKSDRDIYPEKSLLIAQMYVDYLLDKGIKRSDILLDPVIKPLEVNFLNGKSFLNTLELFKIDFPQVKTIANLTALSDGLPKRYLITSHFLSLAINNGLDYVVLDVLERSITESIMSTMCIIGKDRNLKSYLNYCRNNRDINGYNIKEN